MISTLVEKAKSRSSKAWGEKVESNALSYLKRQGLKYVDRNYYCRSGEIDLIMLDKNVLVFVEVRYRKNSSHGGGLESVNYHKQQKLIKTALHYLQAKRLLEKVSCRFDVIAVDADNMTTNKEMTWIKDAFQA